MAEARKELPRKFLRLADSFQANHISFIELEKNGLQIYFSGNLFSSANGACTSGRPILSDGITTITRK